MSANQMPQEADVSTMSRQILSLANQVDPRIRGSVIHVHDGVAELETTHHDMTEALQRSVNLGIDLMARATSAEAIVGRLRSSYRHALEQDFEHTHPEGEGEPECPACWVQTMANILGVDGD